MDANNWFNGDPPDDDPEGEHQDEQEPPEPDGETFRGNEAAAYEREQQAAIQRTLK